MMSEEEQLPNELLQEDTLRAAINNAINELVDGLSFMFSEMHGERLVPDNAIFLDNLTMATVRRFFEIVKEELLKVKLALAPETPSPGDLALVKQVLRQNKQMISSNSQLFQEISDIYY